MFLLGDDISTLRKPHFWCIYNVFDGRSIEGLVFDEARAFVSAIDSQALNQWYVWREGWDQWRPVQTVDGLTEVLNRIMPVKPPPQPARVNASTKSTLTNLQSVAPRAKETVSEQKPNNSDFVKQKAAVMPAPFARTPAPSLSQKQSVDETNRSILQQKPSDSNISVMNNEFIVRNRKRFIRRYEIIIQAQDKNEFRTYTKDVSVGGVLLEDSLPDWVTGYFKVRIAKPQNKEKLEMTCCLIEDQAPGQRVRLAFLPLESLEDENRLEEWLAA